MSGQKLEIEPFCPPTDLIMAFSKARRRIYMTATLTAATPAIIHPLRTLGDGATAVSGMRVITGDELDKLRKALESFARALGDSDTINSIKKINELINAHGFGTEFLKRYTKEPK